MTTHLRNAIAWISLVAIPLVAGCDSSVHPFVPEERPFTLWGILDAAVDTQFVRVFTIEEQPGIHRPDHPDAVVTSTDLVAGESREWTYRRREYDDGTVGHLYWSPFRPRHGHRYRIDVRRSDGETSTATVTVPPEVDVTIERSETSPRVTAYVRGEDLNLLDVEMRYEATNVPPANSWPQDLPIHPQVYHPVEVSHQDDGEPFQEGTFFSFDMAEDFEIVRNEYVGKCLITEGNPHIALRRVEFHLIVADTTWQPPGGQFDPNLLIQPGAFSNVENGYGFIGAGIIHAERWTPSPSVRTLMGYRSEQGCSMFPGPTPACTQPPIPCLDDHFEGIEQYFQ